MPAGNPAWKVSYAIDQQSSASYGWKTSFWNNAPDKVTLQPFADALESKLNVLLGTSTLINFVSYKDMSKQRLVYLKERDEGAGTITDTNDSDFPETSILVELRAASGRKTNVWISGIRDVYIGQSGRLRKGADVLKDLWNPVKAELANTNNLWCIRTQNYDKPLTVIRSINLTTGLITCEGNHGFTLNTLRKAKLTGVTLPLRLRGVKKVVADSATTLQITPWTAVTGETVVLKETAAVREYEYFYEQIVSAEALRSTGHQRGRPTRVGSGRR